MEKINIEKFNRITNGFVVLFNEDKLKNIGNNNSISISITDKEKLYSCLSEGRKLIISNEKEYLDFVKELKLIEFEQYIIIDYFFKKVALIYGNCHTTAIRNIMNQCKEFTDEYVFYPLKAIQEIFKEDKEYYFKHPIFKFCDLFIHQSIQKSCRYGESYSSENVMKLIPNTSIVISIPNVYQMPTCFFPQYKKDYEFKYKNGITIFFRDSIIDENYKNGLSVKKIKELYEKTDLFDDNEIRKNFDLFIEKLKKRECDWDIKITQFILENYKKERLFYDPNHPTGIVFKCIAKSILKKLDIDFDEKNLDKILIEHYDTFEMPICVSTKKALNLIFEDEKEIRKTGCKFVIGKMNLEKYIKQYIAFEWQDKTLSRKKCFFSKIRYFFYSLINFCFRAVRKIYRIFRNIRRHDKKLIRTSGIVIR